MEYVYIIIGGALAFFGLKHFDKVKGIGKAVRKHDADLKARQDGVDAEVNALKDKIKNVKDDRKDREGYWNQ